MLRPDTSILSVRYAFPPDEIEMSLANNMNFSVTVDTNQLEADAETLKQKITDQAATKVKQRAAEEISRPINEFGSRPKSQGVR
jgi:hypothetical protein